MPGGGSSNFSCTNQLCLLMLVFFEEAAEEQQLCLASSQMYGKDLLSNLSYSVGPETTRAVFCPSVARASEQPKDWCAQEADWPA